MGAASGRLSRTGRRWSAVGVVVLLAIAASPALAGNHGRGDDQQNHGGNGAGPGAAASGDTVAPAQDSAQQQHEAARQDRAAARQQRREAKRAQHEAAQQETEAQQQHAATKQDRAAARQQRREAKRAQQDERQAARQQRQAAKRAQHAAVQRERADAQQQRQANRRSGRARGPGVTPPSVAVPQAATPAPRAAAAPATVTPAPRARLWRIPSNVVAAGRAWATRGARTRRGAPAAATAVNDATLVAGPLPDAAPVALPGPARDTGARPAAAQQRQATAQDEARIRTQMQILPMVLDRLGRTAAVVPGAVWAAIGALVVLAAMLLAVALTRHRRARHLTRERDDLLADIEALESAVSPTLPEALGGLALSVSSAPAVKPVAGGDFHDAFALSRDRVAVIIGDVAGHGRQALADAQLVRHAVRAYLEAGLDPRGALAMTGTVVEEREEPLFASVVVAVHDRRDGTLTFASAGHEPPIIVTDHGASLPPVPGWSPPLGTGLETGRRQTSMPLPEGAAVCLVTDGVTEARSGGERMGVSRVIRWLSALGPGAMSIDVITRLREESDVPEDDATVCMLRALTPASPAAPRIEEAVVEGGDPTYLVRFLRDCGLPFDDAEEAGEALAAAPDGMRMIASVEIRGGRAMVELAPIGSAAVGLAAHH